MPLGCRGDASQLVSTRWWLATVFTTAAPLPLSFFHLVILGLDLLFVVVVVFCWWGSISLSLTLYHLVNPPLFSLLGWFEGQWRAMPFLQSSDVSCTSRWQSTGELPYLTDEDNPLEGSLVLNSFFSKGTGGWNVLSATIQWNLVTFNSKVASSIIQTGFDHLMKIALLCNLSAQLPCPRALLGNGSFLRASKDWKLHLSGPHIVVGIEWWHLWCFCYTRRAPCEQSAWNKEIGVAWNSTLASIVN